MWPPPPFWLPLSPAAFSLAITNFLPSPHFLPSFPSLPVSFLDFHPALSSFFLTTLLLPSAVLSPFFFFFSFCCFHWFSSFYLFLLLYFLRVLLYPYAITSRLLSGQYLKQACCADWRRRPSSAEDPPIGKIHPFSKMAVTFEPWWDFDALRDLESSWALWHSLFYNWKTYL